MQGKQKLLLLWVHLVVEDKRSSLHNQFAEHCEVCLLRPGLRVDEQLRWGGHNILCVEYDYPDCDSLQQLRQIRESNPDVPVVMFTLQHSESLAIWVLRNRLFDYRCKPIDEQEVPKICRAWVTPPPEPNPAVR